MLRRYLLRDEIVKPKTRVISVRAERVADRIFGIHVIASIIIRVACKLYSTLAGNLFDI